MDTARWKRIKEVFERAAGLPADERRVYIEGACGDDDELRTEVESLLAHDLDDDDTEFRGAVVEAAGAMHDVPDIQGQRLGPYRLERELGRGGMGTVWLAIRDDEEFDKKVAIKMLRQAAGGEARARFIAERQILATLDHPNIARLLDGGTTDDGVPYVVMEYVDGMPIDDYCADNELSVDGRIELFRSVCSAVQFAHHNLIVHRDIKPGNILVDSSGTPKLLDFGIAKLLDSNVIDGSSPHTVTGTQLLTPRYASPEQVRGKNITTASDVYSLGVLLYELLAGQGPYSQTGEQPSELAKAICDEDPDRPSSKVRKLRHTGDDRTVGVSHDARDVAGDLDNIVLKAMRKNPGDRYGSAGEFADDLDRYRKRLPVEARPATLRYRIQRFCSRHRFAVAGSAAMVVALLGATLFSLAQMRTAVQASARMEKEKFAAQTQARRTALEAARTSLLSGDTDVALDILESVPEPEREWAWRHLHGLLDRAIAITQVGNASGIGITPEADLIVAVLPSGELRWIDPFSDETKASVTLSPEGVEYAALSADCRFLVATYGAEPLRLAGWEIEGAGQAEQVFLHELDDPIRAVAVSEMGNRYAATTDDEAFVWTRTSARPIVWRHEERGVGVTLGKDGSFLGLLADRERWLVDKLYDVNNERVLGGGRSIHSLAISPDGLFFAQGRRGGATRIRDMEHQMSQGQFMGHSGTANWVAFHPTGQWVASASDDTTVRVWDTQFEHTPIVLSGHQHPIRFVRFNSDGQYLLSLDRGGVARVWEHGPEPSHLVLRGHTGRLVDTSYEPLSGQLVMASARGQLLFFDSATLRRFDGLTLPNHRIDAYAASSKGGLFATAHESRVVFRRFDSPLEESLLTDEGRPVQDLAFSPDGESLAVLFTEGGVAVYDTVSKERTAFYEDPDQLESARLLYSKDGKLLATSGAEAVNVLDARAGQQRCTTRITDQVAYGLAFSPQDDVLASGWSDGVTRLIDLYSCEVLAELPGHTELVESLAYTPDGSTLASGANDATVVIRDVQTGQISMRFIGRGYKVVDLNYADDGETLLASSDAVRVWSTRAAHEIWSARTFEREQLDEAHEILRRTLDESPEIHTALGRLRAVRDVDPEVRRIALRLALNPPIPESAEEKPRSRSLEFQEPGSLIDFSKALPLEIGNQLTMEGWVKPYRFAGQRLGNSINAAGSWNDAGRYVFGSGALFWVKMTPRGALQTIIGRAGGGWTTFTSARYALPPDRWSHVAFVMDGATLQLYINGHLAEHRVIRDPRKNPSIQARTLVIGGRHASATRFQGKIDQVRIWNVARTGPQIEGAMHRRVAPSEPGLFAAWRLDEGRGSIATDVRGRLDGRIRGARWIEPLP